MKPKKNLKSMNKGGLKVLIRSITKNSDDYDKKYIKTKFNLDQVNNKYYLQVFLDQCL